MGKVINVDFSREYDLGYNHIWECNCENTSFILTEAGIYCQECGTLQHSELWEYSLLEDI